MQQIRDLKGPFFIEIRPLKRLKIDYIDSIDYIKSLFYIYIIIYNQYNHIINRYKLYKKYIYI